MHKRNKNLSRLGIFLILAAVVSFIVFYISVMLSNQGYSYVDAETLVLTQTQEIPDGQPTAVIETTMGEIRAVLYPEYAPETVENFSALAQAGFYDNTLIYDARQNVYFAAGAVDRDGNPKAQIRDNQEHIPRELHQNLWPFRGALCALNTCAEGNVFDRFFKNEKYFTGSRFRVLDSVDFSDAEFAAQFREASGSQELADAFLERGGIPNYSQQLTIFGQVYAGFDVIAQITGASLEEETNLSGYIPPAEDIYILSVTLGEYGDTDAQINELP